ncbi:MAG: class I SAM-dependent methyltransferase [Deltaproteobacteria bacterium]|nr:class I SAM-dependent methyltransferase [Deltaproteobacteria bacterium]
MPEVRVDAGSFRDPAGFVYRRGGRLLRQINPSGVPLYRALMDSGLYHTLVQDGLLVAHQEVDLSEAATEEAALVLAPEALPFISYPYEWSFSQLKDAALLTLDVQRRAIEAGLTTRDASAYNVQWDGHRPVFIDTLSLGPWTDGRPWEGYQQFCRHFLAPLALAVAGGPALLSTLRVHLDGVPLQLASRLLGGSTWMRFGLLTHVHLHARSIDKHGGQAGGGAGEAAPPMSRTAMLALIESLRGTVLGLKLPAQRSEWAAYYDATNYSQAGRDHKGLLVRSFLEQLAATGPLDLVWDLGANTGVYSRIPAELGARVIAFDIDEGAVEQHYLALRGASEQGSLTPLRLDLRNPSPGLGWAHEERASLQGRGPADAVMALALIHHLAISNNTPLDHIARYLSRLGRHLILEMVPKEDSQVQRLLASRSDIFPDYTIDGFELAFSRHFEIVRREPIPDTRRYLYLLRARAER